MLEYETLTGNEIFKVLSGKPLNRDIDDFDEPEDPKNKDSLTAIPKTGADRRGKKGGGYKPQPQG